MQKYDMAQKEHEVFFSFPSDLKWLLKFLEKQFQLVNYNECTIISSRFAYACYFLS